MCLDISGARKENGAKIILWEKHGKKNQQWYIK
jgi:hypothetical protein